MSELDNFTDLFDLDLNESFKRFSKPIFDVNLSLEETMDQFLEDLPGRKRDRRMPE
jgi:hypothetical protein